MAGTVVVTETRWSGVKKIIFDWTSAAPVADGNADGVTVYPYEGVIQRLVFIPATGGDKPTAAYDVRVLDSDGIDVAAGNGADLSDTVALNCFPHSATKPIEHIIAHTKLTLEVRNAGNSKKGRVVVYIR